MPGVHSASNEPASELARSLLVGAVDLHRHGRPEFSPDLQTGLDDAEDIALCRDAGFSAVAMKSHLWPTYDRVASLRPQVSDIEIVSTITLNPVAGGLDPYVVDLAARHGARVLYLPTWGARHDRLVGGLSARLSKVLGWDLPVECGISLIDEKGELSAPARAVLDVADSHGMTVFTGHVSPRESAAVADAGFAQGRLVFSHPDSHSVGASMDEVESMAEAGAFVELCAIGAHPGIGRVTFPELVHLVRRVGASACVITSDLFFPWSGSSPQLLGWFLDGLLEAGATSGELREMLCTNPSRLLAASRASNEQPAVAGGSA
jgi:Family of unknown function (DUF6282)